MVDAFVLLNNCQRCFGRDRLVPPRPAVELVPDQSPYSERGFSFNAARLQNKPVSTVICLEQTVTFKYSVVH